MTARQLWDTLTAMNAGPGDVPPRLKIDANGRPLPSLIGQLSEMHPDGTDIFCLHIREDNQTDLRTVRVMCDYDCITMLTPMVKRTAGCPKCGDAGEWINLGLRCRAGHGMFG